MFINSVILWIKENELELSVFTAYCVECWLVLFAGAVLLGYV